MSSYSKIIIVPGYHGLYFKCNFARLLLPRVPATEEEYRSYGFFFSKTLKNNILAFFLRKNPRQSCHQVYLLICHIQFRAVEFIEIFYNDNSCLGDRYFSPSPHFPYTGDI